MLQIRDAGERLLELRFQHVRATFGGDIGPRREIGETGGRGGIRTHGEVSPTAVFKTDKLFSVPFKNRVEIAG
ncbi:hypothetical protein [Methylosinus sp. Ce-a6]|uniref:hypothetical protein n=1 Tax=Methylosinus sp. Ce-a6 TaxID=2172005 RepID=UPI00135C7863|nr:hypothetical protein [Methylosinus sp. Ce-a6]